MGMGYLRVRTTTADGNLPVANVKVTVSDADGNKLYELYTDASASTESVELPAPAKEKTLDPNYTGRPFALYNVNVEAPGFITQHIHEVGVVDTQTSILPVQMKPLLDEVGRETDVDVYLDYSPLKDTVNRQFTAPTPRVLKNVIIPEYITVHLGTPSNTSARNVRVRFPEYIANVASNEIYSTWPQSSLEANIHAITTFALNRVYTEWYRIRGYNFDITNSTAYDMMYRDGSVIFENISRIVDNIFNVYAHRAGFQNPFFTSFCNGTTSTCAGLSQWGTVSLANQGLTPLQILRRFYTNDIELSTSNNIAGITASFPGVSLRVGSVGESVRTMQNHLNRIAVNYPLIPQISNPNGTFDSETEAAVKTFQRVFDLYPDGVIGGATWNKISWLFVGITRLGELDSEGTRIGISGNPPNVVLSRGSRGQHVLELEFLLNFISMYYDTVPSVVRNSVFDESVRNSVIEFQRTFGLTPDGIVGRNTWNKLYSVYRGIEDNVVVPEAPTTPPIVPSFPGTPLRVGSTGSNVSLMQTYLNALRARHSNIPALVVDGVFGPMTGNAVMEFQRAVGLTPDGIIGPVTWNAIVSEYQALDNVQDNPPFPGTLLRVGSRGDSVWLMQTRLDMLRQANPSLLPVAIDGIFGPQTQSAVMAFQRSAGLSSDGIIGPLTWNAIVTQSNAL